MRPILTHVAHDDEHDRTPVSPPNSELQTPPRLQLVPSRPLFTNPVEIYLANLKPTGRRSQRSKLEKVASLFGLSLADFGLTQVTYQSVITARAALQEAMAPETVNTTLSALKGVARVAYDLGAITAEEFNRIKGVQRVRGSRIPPGRALTGEEMEALLDTCDEDRTPRGVRDAALIGLTFHVLLRRSECAGLQLHDYHEGSRALLIRGKGSKERVVYIQDAGAARALNDWLKLRGRDAGPLFCPVLKSGRVVIRPLGDQAVYEVITSRGAEAGLGKLTPHDARRTGITNLIEAGADLGAIQDLAGHSSLATTSKYRRTREDAKRRAASMVAMPYKGRRIARPTKPAAEQLDLLEGGSDDKASGPS
jgi:site-specific recombinase XerD